MKHAKAVPQARQFSSAYRWYALGLLTLVYIANYVDRQILAILLVPIKSTFDLTDTQLGILTGPTFAAFYATLGIPIAMWGDRGNRRNIIGLSLGLFSFFTVLCGYATSYMMLVWTRIGVAIGEAGSSPPSHSMIADMFPPKTRARALAIFSLGVNIGILIGFYAGGVVAELYGWRVAFFVAGGAGVILLLLVFLTLKESPRGMSENHTVTVKDAPTFGQVMAYLLKSRAFCHISAGAALVSLVGYASISWLPSFFVRSHTMTLGEAGTMLAIVIGVAGSFGTLLGGYLADTLAKKDVRWNMWVVSLAYVVTTPVGVMTFLATDSFVAILCFIPAAAVGALYLGPALAMAQGIAKLRMRVMASALFLFILNIVGLGLGPLLVGVASDLLQPFYGKESLRYALVGSSIFYYWGAWHFYAAARHLKNDLSKARL